MSIINTASKYQTRLRAWGTSHAVHIPEFLCNELGISSGSTLVLEHGVDECGPYLVLRPHDASHRGFSDAPFVSIDDLFAGYGGDYRPTEADWGDVGDEVVV